MEPPPTAQARGLFSLTHGVQVYAGHHLMEDAFAPHTHSFVEVVVVTAGEGEHHSSAGRHRLRVGDVMLLRPGPWHGYENCRGLDLYVCCFGAELLLRELEWMRDDPLLGHLLWTGPRSADRNGLLALRLGETALQECLRHLDALNTLRHAPAPQRRGDLIGHLTLFLGVLARASAERSPNGRPGARTPPVVVRAMRLLESRYARPWTVAELAGELHVSAGYLARQFKTATGLPPMAYLSQYRVETAAALLLRTDLPVGHVGREVGWPDANLFARRFRAHAAMSPSAYRRRFTSGEGAGGVG
ncbi:AraC family transcriptional regulator [Streptomyces sp. NPDC004539]|uniref:AraC family transcriptional regulator n=1 Tax=Streptomyces sp. NPDC004539 TaxID=3154280 RepID=UPI0033B6324D